MTEIGREPNKIPEAVLKAVRDIEKGGEKKREIDTKDEFDKLSDYLAGLNEPNAETVDFIQSKLDGYKQMEAQKEEKAFMEKVSDYAKTLVKKMAKGGMDDNKIDRQSEASDLLAARNNDKSLSGDDKDYIDKVLKESGFLKEEPTPTPTTNEAMPKDNTPPVDAKVPEKSKNDKPKQSKSVPSKGKPVKHKPVNPTPPNDKPKTDEVKKSHIVIPENISQQADGVAENIDKTQIKKEYTNKEVVNALSKVNRTNAYSVLNNLKAKTGKDFNEFIFGIKDKADIIKYKNSLDVMTTLYNQAVGFKLGNTPAAKNLLNVIKEGRAMQKNDPTVDPNPRVIKEADKAINDMLNEIAKHEQRGVVTD